MRLHASVRPPAPVVEDLEAALGPEYAYPGQIAWLPPAHWRIHITGFGNVVHGDSLRLGDVLDERIGQIDPPALRTTGLIALPEDAVDSIWVGVEGDVDTLADIAATMPRWVLEFGFVPDRRAYKPRIQVGRVTPLTTVQYLEGLVERVGAYPGVDWVSDAVTLGHEEAASPEHEARFEVARLAHFGRTQGRHKAGEAVESSTS